MSNRLEILKEGQYGTVSLIRGDITSSDERALAEQYTGFLPSMITALLRRNKVREKIMNTIVVAKHVVCQGQVGERDLDRLPKGFSREDQIVNAHFLALLSEFYNQRARSRHQSEGGMPPYFKGFFLSDFFEVIPPERSSRILLASADPDLSRSVFEGGYYQIARGIDPQESAIETVVLLPDEVRHDIFRKMAELDSRRIGRAHRFLSLIASEWFSQSGRSGLAAIYTNFKLDPELAGEIVLASHADLAACRKIIEEVEKSKQLVSAT